jgi:hypothetical protein
MALQPFVLAVLQLAKKAEECPLNLALIAEHPLDFCAFLPVEGRLQWGVLFRRRMRALPVHASGNIDQDPGGLETSLGQCMLQRFALYPLGTLKAPPKKGEAVYESVLQGALGRQGALHFHEELREVLLGFTEDQQGRGIRPVLEGIPRSSGLS